MAPAKRTTHRIVQDLQAEIAVLRRQVGLLFFLVLFSFVAITFPETIAVFRIVLIGVAILFAVVLLASFVRATRSWLRYRRAIKWAVRQGLFPVTNDPKEEEKDSDAAGGASETRGQPGPGSGR